VARMRILFIAPAISIHTQRWVEAMCALGHTVALATQHHDETWAFPRSLTYRVLPVSSALGYVANALSLRRFVHGFRPDIVNTHYASGYGTLSALIHYTPTLLSVWGSDVYDFPTTSPLHRSLVRWNLRRASAIASTSEAMAAHVKRLEKSISSVSVTPFGVDTKMFSPLAEAVSRDGNVVIGTVKTLDRKYGVDLLVKSFARLLADPEVMEAALSDSLTLRIVGDGPERPALEALAISERVAHRTQFIGAVSHSTVPRELRRLDIYVAASRFESFGVAVVEASACGLPVVVSDVAGLAEVVLHGQTGLVVERENIDALTDSIRSLVVDPGLRARLAAQGRSHVVSTYDWADCVTRMTEAYVSARSGLTATME